MTVAISVVIPTCGRPELLDRCLAALTAQSLAPDRYEIVVVDDRPNEATRNLVYQWAAQNLGQGPVVGYIPSPGPHGPAAARNFGWRAARASIIAFTDDDTIPRGDWLENGLRACDDGVHAAWGRIVMPLPPEPTDYERDASHLTRAEFVTANCFCRKALLEQIGGFDERFRLAWREDSDLYFNLLRRQARIVHVPDAVVEHPVRPAPWGVSLKQQKKVFFDALLFKKHPYLYRRKIRTTPRWDYYLIVASLLGAGLGALLHAPLFTIGCGALWLTLTARFCRQRLRGTSRAPLHVAEMAITSALIPPVAVFWRLLGALKFRVAFV